MKLNLTRQEVFKLLYELYNELEYRGRYKKSQLLGTGYIQEDERVTFENINMDDLEDKLIIVLANIHRNIALYNFTPEVMKMSLKVCLAGICQIIKSKFYLNSIGKTYRELTGLEFNNTMYYNILEKAFKLEGILPNNWHNIKGQSFRFKDVLIHEAGIPASVAKKLVTFFLLYWKYMRNIPWDKFLDNTDEYRNKSNFHFEATDYSSFWKLYEELAEYPQKLFKVMTQLSKICKFLETYEFEHEDLDDKEVVENINQKVGFNIFSILPRNDSLSFLYKQVMNKITPNKLMRILSRKPKELHIITPSESRVKVGNYTEFEFGRYIVSGVEYTVVPDTSLSIDNLLSWKNCECIYDAEKVGYKSNSEFEVKFGNNRIFKALPLYLNGINKGYFWYGNRLDGVPLFIDKKLIYPSNPIHFNKYLRYYWDDQLKTYGFKIKLTDIRLYLPEYKNRHVEIVCKYSNIVENFVLNQLGCKEIEKTQFKLDDTWDGSSLEIKLNIKELGSVNTIHSFEENYDNSLFCFNTITKSHVPPKEYAFGIDKLILFVRKTVNSTVVYDEDVAKLKKYPNDIFDIYAITWDKKDVPLSFNIGENKWTFRQPLIFYLQNVKDELSPKDEFDYSEYEQCSDLNSLRYEVSTNLLYEELISNVYLLIFLNDQAFKEIKLSKVIKLSNKKVIIDGQSIIDSSSLNKDYTGNISLSFNYKQTTLYEKNIRIFPRISIENMNQLFIEGEQVKVKLKSSHPCFYKDGSYLNQIEKTIGIAKLICEDGKIYPDICEDGIYLSGVDSNFKLNFKPKILGFRFERKKDNSIYHSKSIKYSDIEKYRLVINGLPENKITLNISDFKEEIKLDRSGSIKINLKDIKGYIYNLKTNIKIKQNIKEIGFGVYWQPHVFNIYQQDNEITDFVKFNLDYEGPRSTSIWFEIVDSSAGLLCKHEVKCIGKRIKKEISIDLPKNYNTNEIIVNGYLSPDDDSSFAELYYKVKIENKASSEVLEDDTSLQIERYTFNDFINDIEKISSLTMKFAKKEFLIGD